MKIRFLIVFALIGFSCQQEHNQEYAASESNEISAKIANYFEENNALLTKENGSFWGKNLHGPMMIVAPESRKIWANQNSKSNKLEADGRLFIGTLSQKYTIANKAFDWEGERWTMIMAPLPALASDRNALMIHESFHREQPSLGFASLKEGENGHLDSRIGRTYLKLELEALKKALQSNDPRGILHHVQHAFWFRKIRHEIFENAMLSENQLEINEGLAEYTGLMICGRNRADQILHLENAIDTFYKNPTFIRSFAYFTIPTYGFLLSQLKSMWHKNVTADTNLTAFLSQAFKVEYPEDLSAQIELIKVSYNFPLIEAEETVREQQRVTILNDYKQRLLVDSFLIIPFQNMKISFDPNNIIAIENIGKIYPNATVIDDWGKLEVKNGALISDNWDKITVSRPIDTFDSLIIGDGWALKLEKTWTVSQIENHYRLIRVIE